MSNQAYVGELASANKSNAQHNHDVHTHYAKAEESPRLSHDDHFSPTLDHHDGENAFYRYRGILFEYIGEFFGTMILCIFGLGANCQVVLTNNALVASLPAGNWTSLSFGWGVGVALGVWISGGHINPAVTLAFAVWRGFPWKKVPLYFLAQLLGALVGAAIIYGNYIHAIDIVEGGRGIRTMKTATLFATAPAAYMTSVSAFFSEFLGTAMLVFGILVFTDKRNNIPSHFIPLGVFLVLCGIAICLGFETGFALNPARDLGPRMLTAMVGYGKQVFTMRHQYWVWCPVMATILGAQVAAFIYDLLIYPGTDSLVYKMLGPRRRAHDSSGQNTIV